MRTFEMAQNASIAFRVGSLYKKSLNPTCVLSKWPKMQVLHLGQVFRVGYVINRVARLVGQVVSIVARQKSEQGRKVSRVAMCEVRSREKRARTKKKSTMVRSKKKWTVTNPIRRRMKKRNPSSGQNGQLVLWWLLIHSGRQLGVQFLTASCGVPQRTCRPTPPKLHKYGPLETRIQGSKSSRSNLKQIEL